MGFMGVRWLSLAATEAIAFMLAITLVSLTVGGFTTSLLLFVDNFLPAVPLRDFFLGLPTAADDFSSLFTVFTQGSMLPFVLNLCDFPPITPLHFVEPHLHFYKTK